MGLGGREHSGSLVDLAPCRDARPEEQEFTRAPVAVPENPPFQAHVSNLSFEVTDEDLKDFFKDQLIKSIKIVCDPIQNCSKGFGYIEFEDKESLVQALTLNQTVCRNIAP